MDVWLKLLAVVLVLAGAALLWYGGRPFPVSSEGSPADEPKGDVMPQPPDRFYFKLEFRSLAEFAAFVAILRGDDFAEEGKLRELTAQLKRSTDDAEKAVATATEDT